MECVSTVKMVSVWLFWSKMTNFLFITDNAKAI